MRSLVNPELVTGDCVGQPLVVAGDEVAAVVPAPVGVVWPEREARCGMECMNSNDRSWFYDMK